MENIENQVEKYSILIVDDQPNNIKVISNVLSDGYNLYIANSGEKALQILEKVQPDLILLDIMMPGMSGFEVCEIIKSKEAIKEIPIIFLTAKAETDDIIQGFELGAVDYITKPFSTKEVNVRIKNHISLAVAVKTIKMQNQLMAQFQRNLIKMNEDLIASKDAIEQNAFELNVLNSRLLESEESLQMTNQKLIVSNQEKDKFFSIIAHDLRSPFSGFLGMIELLANEPDTFTHSELNDFMHNMSHTANNLYKLLENLLQWARMQRGNMAFNMEPIFLEYLVSSNIEIISANANAKNIQIINHISNEMKVNADEAMLNGVFRNLLSNAVKFTPIDGRIEIGIFDNDPVKYPDIPNDQAIIYVRDSGIGIPPELLKKLFTLGEKTSRPGTEGESSTGLGLLLCKDFIEKHNGKFWVESIENEGASFCFSLPKI